MPLPREDDPRNWQEDFPHENGNYFHLCCECRNEFLGHKRRVRCKVCHERLTAEYQAAGNFQI